MQLTIVLRKEVENTEEAELLAQTVRDRLADKPLVTVTASVSEKIETPPEQP